MARARHPRLLKPQTAGALQDVSVVWTVPWERARENLPVERSFQIPYERRTRRLESKPYFLARSPRRLPSSATVQGFKARLFLSGILTPTGFSGRGSAGEPGGRLVVLAVIPSASE